MGGAALAQRQIRAVYLGVFPPSGFETHELVNLFTAWPADVSRPVQLAGSGLWSLRVTAPGHGSSGKRLAWGRVSVPAPQMAALSKKIGKMFLDFPRLD